MVARKFAWDFEESLTALTLHSDWDDATSMILSLKLHMAEWGTVPTWNFMFCHGRPELALPYSWAWTWPSIFAYALPAIYAVFAVWFVMSLIGFFSMRALLLRWTGSGLAAGVGAAVYVLSGYFANRFNAGHISFAFFHWIPLLVYLFEVAMDRALRGEKSARSLLGICFATFLLISGGLPQSLLYFFPALLLFIAFSVVRNGLVSGFGIAFRAALLPIVASLLGFLVASYKLWPVIAWQLVSPRTGVKIESYTVIQVITNTLTFVTDYLIPMRRESWHVFPAWGYNAYLGPMPWLCAGVAILAVMRMRWRPTADPMPGRSHAFVFSILLVALGIALSLGNGNAWSPASLFHHLPVFNGIRAFNRYQILIVFGLAILTGLGITALEHALPRRVVLRWPVLAGVIAATLVPLLSQAYLLARNIPAERNEDLVAKYDLDPTAPIPSYVHMEFYGLIDSGHQTAILETGNWIGNCYSALSLPDPPPSTENNLGEISFPPPSAIEELTSNRLTLRYRDIDTVPIRLNLRVLDDFELNTPRRRIDGWMTVRPEDLQDGQLALRSGDRAPAQGRAISYLGLLLCTIFFAWAAWRERASSSGFGV